MKISEEQLKKIIQEELSSALKEGEIDENFLKKAAGSLGGFFKGLTRDPTTDQRKLGSFAIPRDRSMPSGKQEPGITKFTQGPSSQSVQSRPTTSATTPSASGTATQTTGPGETVTNSTTQSAAEQPAQTSATAQPETPPAAAQPEAPAQQPAAPAEVPAAQNPKLMKRMELFKQNMPQYFQAIQKKIADVIKGAVSANVQQIKEAADPSSVISSLISKELNNALAGALKTVTLEDFLKAYQMVAKKNIKDPKQLAQSLKNFRGLEEQETVDVNPLAGTEMDLFDAVLQAKRIGISSLVKQAAEKALANPQVQKYMPPEQATKVVASLTSAARTVRQLLAMNPASTAQTIAKSAPAATPPAQPAAQPKAAASAKKSSKKQAAPVEESYKATYDKWKKIIKG